MRLFKRKKPKPSSPQSIKPLTPSSATPKPTPAVTKQISETPATPKKKRQPDFFMKLVLCGDGAVGKTALRERFLGKGFSSSYLQTIGADFAAKDETIGDKLVKYQIWDLAGQQTFQQVRGTYYEGCFGALMVFDLTRPDSFENIPNWIEELWSSSKRGPVPVVLLGNKYDLLDQFPAHVTQDQVDTYLKELNTVCQDHQFQVPFLFTSAKTGHQVDKAFQLLGENILSWIETQL